MNREQVISFYTTHARAMAGSLAIALVAAGVQLFMVTYGLAVFFETPRAERKERRRYMVANVLLFIIPTVANVPLFYRYFTLWFVSESALDYGKQRAQDLVWAAHIANSLGNLSVCVGDALLLYRCWIVWADKMWVGCGSRSFPF